MKVSIVLVLAMLAVSIAGCSRIKTVTVSQPDRLAANESRFHDSATIYVFRGSSRAGVMWSFPVKMDQARIGSIRREEYLVFPASPGSHWLEVTCASLCELPGFKLNLEVAAGKSYYFVVDPEMTLGGSIMTMSSQITQIDKRSADRLLATYDASDVSGQKIER